MPFQPQDSSILTFPRTKEEGEFFFSLAYLGIWALFGPFYDAEEKIIELVYLPLRFC